MYLEILCSGYNNSLENAGVLLCVFYFIYKCIQFRVNWYIRIVEKVRTLKETMKPPNQLANKQTN